MRLSPPITAEDRWVIVSVALTLSGIILGARLALIVVGLLFVAFSVTHSPRLSWLLLFGLVAGVMELWADWVHVFIFIRSCIPITSASSFSPHPLTWWLTVVQFGYVLGRNMVAALGAAQG
jgi:hypothetical protein